MTETVSMDSREFEAALAVLEREQAAWMPTRRQEICFHLFNWAVFLFLGIAAVEFVTASFGALSDLTDFFWIPLGLAILAITVLFFLNLGLVRKLSRQAQLRRKLQLTGQLRPVFRRRRNPFINAVTAIVAFLGLFLLVIATFLLFLFGLCVGTVSEVNEILQFLPILFLFVVAFVVSLSLLFLHFMRRGKERLEMVKKLQEPLLRHRKNSDADTELQVSAAAYDRIATMEREHIIVDRAQSIAKAHKEVGRGSGYVVQNSRDVLIAKAQLDLDSRLRVDDEILRLAADPFPKSIRKDDATGPLQHSVAGTGIAILYEVDKKERRIKLLTLQAAGS